MMIVVLQGSVVLEDASGLELTKPVESKLSWLTREDGTFELRFLTAHRLFVPSETTGDVWLRFNDSNGDPLVRLPQGTTNEVRVVPQPPHFDTGGATFSRKVQMAQPTRANLN